MIEKTARYFFVSCPGDHHKVIGRLKCFIPRANTAIEIKGLFEYQDVLGPRADNFSR